MHITLNNLLFFNVAVECGMIFYSASTFSLQLNSITVNFAADRLGQNLNKGALIYMKISNSNNPFTLQRLKVFNL